MKKEDLISISKWLTGLVIPCIIIIISRDWNKFESLAAVNVLIGNFVVSSALVLIGAWWATQEERKVKWVRFFTYIAQVSILTMFSISYSENLSGFPLGIVLMVTCGTVIASGNHISRRYSPKTQPDELVNASSAAGSSDSHLHD